MADDVFFFSFFTPPQDNKCNYDNYFRESKTVAGVTLAQLYPYVQDQDGTWNGIVLYYQQQSQSGKQPPPASSTPIRLSEPCNDNRWYHLTSLAECKEHAGIAYAGNGAYSRDDAKGPRGCYRQSRVTVDNLGPKQSHFNYFNLASTLDECGEFNSTFYYAPQGATEMSLYTVKSAMTSICGRKTRFCDFQDASAPHVLDTGCYCGNDKTTTCDSTSGFICNGGTKTCR